MVDEGLTMMKPNFNTMTRQELRGYILTHRDDDEAIEILIKMGNSNDSKYPYPQTDEDFRQMEEILKRKLDNMRGST